MTEQERLGISDETMKKMADFFMRTSIPRILEEMERKADERLHQK